jgi:GT2 family glycosyltransferase
MTAGRLDQKSRFSPYRPPRRPAQPQPPVRTEGHVEVRGKFLFANGQKYFVKGVTYGPFKPTESGSEYKTPDIVARDFAAMREAGINTVRTYTKVDPWLLDIAKANGLRVLVGIAWAQHVAFLDDDKIRESIEDSVREAIRATAGHEAVLGYAIGNEIPASIVRWYGREKIEQFIRALYNIAKKEDPDALVTYVNYPTTEYLQLPFLDFLCFNVYLEKGEDFSAYIARLQNLAEDKPVVLGELGLDSQRNGLDGQADSLQSQIRRAFGGGCAGVCVFAWTDEWFRGGHEIEDWAFGLTDRDRNPKPSLTSVRDTFHELPFSLDVAWPSVTVVVCTYNGARHIRETCEHLTRLDYPDYEVIIVSDGSTDKTLAILSEFPFQVIHTENGGLSRARNIGLANARGEIVAYIDDDAYPDEHWLKYLAWSFLNSRHVGIGGPNLPPLDDDLTAFCVANSPGGPNHVLFHDDLAEHIPGCNMAFRRSALVAAGGFDADFRIAGDDVDACWKLQRNGGTLGFSPAALVWHHRRGSIRTYLKQQLNYGRAEAMLAEKWPDKFNAVGHVRWGGRIYGSGRITPPFGKKVAVFHGTWGSAPFQAMYEQPTGLLASITLMPEWHLTVVGLALLSLLGLVWPPLLWTLALLVPALALQLIQAVRGAVAARIDPRRFSRGERVTARIRIALLHYLQPIVRARGRIKQGLHPWRFSAAPHFLRRIRPVAIWHETWASKEARLETLERKLRAIGVQSRRSGDYDAWDLEVGGGHTGKARVLLAIEEHGSGKQLARYRIEPLFSRFARGFLGGSVVALGLVSFTGHPVAIVAVAVVAILGATIAFVEAMAAGGSVIRALESRPKK